MSTAHSREASVKLSAVWPLALTSLVALALEVLLTRVLSYSVHTLLLYAVLGVALLGFGVAGTLVSLVPRWLEPGRLPQMLARASVAAVYAQLVAFASFLRLTPALRDVDAPTLSCAALLTLPFLALGVVITLALATPGSNVARSYAANLIGSGLGCFVPIALLGPLVSQQLLALLALLSWVAALGYVRASGASRGSAIALLHLGALPLLALAFAFADRVFPLLPEPPPLGQVATLTAYTREHGIEMRRRYDGTSAVGRIEIFEFRHVPGAPDPYPFMFYAQDSSAGSTLVRWDGRTRSQGAGPAATASEASGLCDDTLYGAGYLRARKSVLVIGLGGAPDLVCASYHEAQRIDVVEINPRTVEAIRGPFAHFLGGAPLRPAAHFHVQDGRSFAHGARAGSYDLIQLSGVDTKQNLASGSLTLAENHLYTVEAFSDYLRALANDGALAIVRFGEPEALRLANTAGLALRRLGAAHPEQHISIVRDGVLYAVLVRRTPFPKSELDTLAARLAPEHFRGVDVFFARLYDLRFDRPATIAHTPFGPSEPVFARFFTQLARGPSGGFSDHYAFDVAPTSDDRPFFFDLFRHDDWSTFLRAPHMRTLHDILVALALLSVAFVLAPALVQARSLRGPLLVVAPLYFSGLGLAYLLVEVWLLSRFSIYLGHQTHGLGVVLSTLLISSGLGSGLSARSSLSPRSRALLGCGLVTMLLLLARQLVPGLLEASSAWSFAARVLVTIACVAPLGLAMGQPMPAGLAWAGTRAPSSIALCVAINSFASVIATIAVLPLSLFYGYGSVLAAGAGLYALACLTALAMKSEPLTTT